MPSGLSGQRRDHAQFADVRGADPARRAEVNEELEAAIDDVNAKRDSFAKN
jgi:hypothetical protein